MPRLSSHDDRTRCVVEGIDHLVARQGLRPPTLVAISEATRVRRPTLLDHYGDLSQLLRMAAGHTARSRLARIERDVSALGVVGFLPQEDHSLVRCAAWLGWCELGRTLEDFSLIVNAQRSAELACLAATVDYRLERDELVACTALIEGVTAQMCRRVDPLPSTERPRSWSVR
jgi:hypothetical protein